MIQFMDEWLSLAKSGSGERGLINKGDLSKLLPSRRIPVLGEDIKHVGLNPCVTGDTWVQTIEGPKQVSELVGSKLNLIVNGGIESMISDGFFETGTKEVFEVVTDKGYSVKVTEDHKLYKLIYKSAKVQRFEWTETNKLKPGDSIALSNHRETPSWPGKGTFGEGWLRLAKSLVMVGSSSKPKKQKITRHI